MVWFVFSSSFDTLLPDGQTDKEPSFSFHRVCTWKVSVEKIRSRRQCMFTSSLSNYTDFYGLKFPLKIFWISKVKLNWMFSDTNKNLILNRWGQKFNSRNSQCSHYNSFKYLRYLESDLILIGQKLSCRHPEHQHLANSHVSKIFRVNKSAKFSLCRFAPHNFFLWKSSIKSRPIENLQPLPPP